MLKDSKVISAPLGLKVLRVSWVPGGSRDCKVFKVIKAFRAPKAKKVIPEPRAPQV